MLGDNNSFYRPSRVTRGDFDQRRVESVILVPRSAGTVFNECGGLVVDF